MLVAKKKKKQTKEYWQKLHTSIAPKITGLNTDCKAVKFAHKNIREHVLDEELDDESVDMTPKPQCVKEKNIKN